MRRDRTETERSFLHKNRKSVACRLSVGERERVFEIVDDHRAGKVVVNLTGRLNKCGVFSPRFDVQLENLEKWQRNLLPFRQFGIQERVLVVWTSIDGALDSARGSLVPGSVIVPSLA